MTDFTDSPLSPDEEALLAVVDGVASPAEIERIERDADLRDRAAALRDAAERIAAPAEPTHFGREAAVRAALRAFDQLGAGEEYDEGSDRQGERRDVDPVVVPLVAATGPAGANRHTDRRRRWARTALGAAAAVIVLVVGFSVASRFGSSQRDATTAASSGPAPESSGGGSAASDQAAPSTAADLLAGKTAEQAASAAPEAVRDLGELANPSDLARAELDPAGPTVSTQAPAVPAPTDALTNDQASRHVFTACEQALRTADPTLAGAPLAGQATARYLGTPVTVLAFAVAPPAGGPTVVRFYALDAACAVVASFPS